MAASPPSPQPGWYNDPTNPSQARWWDGATWTPAHIALGGPHIYNPDILLRTEEKRFSLSRMLFIAAVIAYIAANTISFLSTQNEVFNLSSGAVPSAAANPVLLIGGAVMDLIELLIDVGIIWFMYQSMSFGRDMGYPSAFEPYWAILAVIIPVADLALPCMTMLTTVSAANRQARRLIIWCWCVFVGSSFLDGIILELHLFGVISTGVETGLYGVGLAVQVVYGVLAYLMVTAIHDDHLATISQLAGTSQSH